MKRHCLSVLVSLFILLALETQGQLVNLTSCTYDNEGKSYNLLPLKAVGYAPLAYSSLDSNGFAFDINFCASVYNSSCYDPTYAINGATGTDYIISPGTCQTQAGTNPIATGDVTSAIWGTFTPVTIQGVFYSDGVVLSYPNGQWCMLPNTARVTNIYVLCDPSTNGRIVEIEEPVNATCVYNIYFASQFGCDNNSNSTIPPPGMLPPTNNTMNTMYMTPISETSAFNIPGEIFVDVSLSLIAFLLFVLVVLVSILVWVVLRVYCKMNSANIQTI